MSTFKEYVKTYIRSSGSNLEHTHTWFSPSEKTKTLHVPVGKTEEFLTRLYEYVSDPKIKAILENPIRGENCITEKITSNGKFKFFADIDFDIMAFETESLPKDITTLLTLMCDLVFLLDKVVEEIYGLDFVSDRIVGDRLPYKIHVIYPNIVVDSKIAKHIAHIFSQRLKNDERFTKVLTEKSTAIDVKPYSTGLRMLGMHKGTMGRKEKTANEMSLHEHIFGENSYRNCYYLTDGDTFQNIDLDFDTFKSSSIRVEQNVDYTPSSDPKITNGIIIRGILPVVI